MSLARFIDHTVLKNTTANADVDRLCSEALRYGFAAVCVPPYFVSNANKRVRDAAVKVATVIGFPFGYHQYDTKLREAERAVEEGADELDMVMNIAAFKSNDLACIETETGLLSRLTSEKGITLKVIIESGVLTDEEIIRCCELYRRYPVQFLKTSTGYAEGGASVHAVELMRKHLPPEIQIKASGGIKTAAFAQALIAAGATRLGTSAGVALVNGEAPLAGY